MPVIYKTPSFKRSLKPLIIPKLAGILIPVDESGVKARFFDGVNDEIRCSIGSANITGAVSMGAILRKKVDNLATPIISSYTSRSDLIWSLSISAENRLSFGKGFTSSTLSTAPTISIVDGWVIIVITKSAGSSIPRGHLYKNGVWEHFDFTTPLGNAVDQAGGDFRFASFVSVAFYSIDLAASVVYDRALSDGEVETINDSTSDFMSLSPKACWDFNQMSVADSVTDLTSGGADQSAITGTTVINDGPPAWTYGASTSNRIMMIV